MPRRVSGQVICEVLNRPGVKALRDLAARRHWETGKLLRNEKRFFRMDLKS